MNLLISVIALAALDSLNPFLFVAQFFLITTPNPVPRLFSYIMGILVVNFTGGVLILGGSQTLIAGLIDNLSNNVIYGAQLLLGLAILIFGIWYKADSDSSELKKPRSLSPTHTFILGAVVMLDEITTAFPYFIAIERVTHAKLSTVYELLLLGLYNLVFSLPLFAFVGLFVIYRKRFVSQLSWITRLIQRWFPPVVKYSSLLFGGLLVADVAVYFYNTV
jgi:cytochrome c biogenesis protein CcdA